LRYHQATKRETENTIVNITDRLKKYRWTRSLSRAALNSRYLTGIELKYHQLNADIGIDMDTFMRRFSHAEIILKEKRIDIYRTNTNRLKERTELVSAYVKFLERRRTEKRGDAIEHDMTVLDAVRAIRSDKTSSLDAGSLLITCDYNLYKFDWEYSRKSNTLPCTVLPNSFWQTLRPFIPSQLDFDRTFAETFAIPEFRTIRSGTAAASSRLMGLLSTYRGLPEKIATRLLSNDTLIISLRSIHDDQQFQETVDVAIVAENDLLREEKAALEKRVEEEITRNRALKEQIYQREQEVIEISRFKTEQINSIESAVMEAKSNECDQNLWEIVIRSPFYPIQTP